MVGLKSPSMVILCLLMLRILIQIFKQKVTKETEGLRAGKRIE